MTLPRKAPLSKGVAEAYVPVAGVARGDVVAVARRRCPSSRLRAVAAATASRRAARTPCCSRTRSPAAVVPPGEVTAARSASAPSSDVGQQGGGAEQRLDAERLADVAGQARRARRPRSAPRPRGTRRPGPEPDRPGDRVEQRLLHAHHECRRRRAGASAHARSSSPACVPGGDGRRAEPDERRRVRHGPHDRRARRERAPRGWRS